MCPPPPPCICCEEAAPVILNDKAARSMLCQMPLIGSCQDYPSFSVAVFFFLFFFSWEGWRSEVNKRQNKQSQSWFGPPDTALHRHVLQLGPYDASPWLFSVNSALSRPSILRYSLMSQQSLPSQPPSPTYLYDPSTLYCTYTAFCFFYYVKLGWNYCLLYKAKPTKIERWVVCLS